MPNRENDKLDIQKKIAGKLMRTAAKGIREAQSPAVAEAYMKAAGKYLHALPGILARFMPDDPSTGSPAPEIQPPQLAELLRRRKAR